MFNLTEENLCTFSSIKRPEVGDVHYMLDKV